VNWKGWALVPWTGVGLVGLDHVVVVVGDRLSLDLTSEAQHFGVLAASCITGLLTTRATFRQH